MPKARRTSYNLALKLKIVAEAEAVENNSEITREYGISESTVHCWRKDQANLFNGEIKLSAKQKTMGCFTPKYLELDQRIFDFFLMACMQTRLFPCQNLLWISVFMHSWNKWLWFQRARPREPYPPEKCRNWLRDGRCQFGRNCKFLHGPFSEPKQRTKSLRSVVRSDVDRWV